MLNMPEGKDEILKLTVLLLLASIYQETDFALSEKMAQTAYNYAVNLGNDILALEAGKILVRLLSLKGDEAGALKQQRLNETHA